jgi:hypothetical protein
MPPLRTPLQDISSNRLSREHLSPYIRGRVIGMSAEGASSSKIARHLDLAESTIKYTIKIDPLRIEGFSIPKAPRQKSYTDADERVLLRHVRLNPKDTYQQTIDACRLSCKRETVKKILKRHGITNWRCKRRPELTEAHAAKRLAWCLKYKDWRVEEWGMICWSDECSCERGRGKRGEWCFRTPLQKWEPRMVQTYGTNKNMKIMVWDAFWDLGRTNLYIMDRDFESQKHGYSANSYLEVCEAEVAPAFATFEPGYLYMQDNASIHTAHIVKDWFLEHRIEMLKDWPPYSPDLNPIEHIWWHLKVRVFDMFPEVMADKSESEHARQRLESCLQAAWDTLDKGLFDNLIQSMPSRIEACIKARGWHTKY